MRARWAKAARWLWRRLAGVQFNRSLDRFEQAAGELDKVVREVLAR